MAMVEAYLDKHVLVFDRELLKKMFEEVGGATCRAHAQSSPEAHQQRR